MSTEQPRILYADTHVHFYPDIHNFGAFLRHAAVNFTNMVRADLDPCFERARIAFVLFLTERSDCNLFNLLLTAHSSVTSGGFTIHRTPEERCLKLSLGPGIASEVVREIQIVAGRQINTKQRLEILALGLDRIPRDGLDMDDTVERVVQSGGTPILAWSPGKWLDQRKNIVVDLIEMGKIDGIGDSSLRPVGWREPRLMRLAKEKGIQVIRGSDPLPLLGEERMVASHGIKLTGEIDLKQPLWSLRQAVNNKEAKISPMGQRSSIPSVFMRLVKHSLYRNRKSKIHEDTVSRTSAVL